MWPPPGIVGNISSLEKIIFFTEKQNWAISESFDLLASPIFGVPSVTATKSKCVNYHLIMRNRLVMSCAHSAVFRRGKREMLLIPGLKIMQNQIITQQAGY